MTTTISSRKHTLSLLLTLSLLFGCNVPQKEGNTPTPFPTKPATPTLIPTNTAIPTNTPIPTFTPTPIPLVVPVEVNQEPIPPQAYDNLDALWTADSPSYDSFEFYGRFGNDVGDRTVTITPPQVGESRSFYVNDDEIVVATLALATENVWFWMENGLQYDTTALQEVAEQIEQTYYPRLTAVFGTEWRPGVDNDPHFGLLHFKGDDDLRDLGFFDSIHQYPAADGRPSNEQEMIFLNMNEFDLGDDLYIGTLVHELQHLIQWNHDPNETVWIDEGLGQLAELVNGLQTADTEDYLADTTVSLTGWSYEDEYIYQHYAASFLFMTYFWEQLGDEAVLALATDPINGITSVRNILAQFAPERSLEQFLADWTATNSIDGDTLENRYNYENLFINYPEPEDTINNAPFGVVNEIAQYGVHYVDIFVPGTYTLTFAGDTTQEILPTVPIEGNEMWVALGFDNVNATLTHAIDLRNTEQATLQFSTWFDIEYDHDFAYVSVSDDGGRTWFPLPLSNYSWSELGDAFNGLSVDQDDQDGNRNGWLAESIPLDDWSGREILLRFELITDWEVAHVGMAIDNIQIPELPNLDLSPETWEAAGFMHSGVSLPQQWSVQLVDNGKITPIELDALNRTRQMIDIPPQGVTVIIMPQTPHVRDNATYWIELDS